MKESITNVDRSEYAYYLIKRIGVKKYKKVIIKNKNGKHYQVLYNDYISLSMKEGSDIMYINLLVTGAKTDELIKIINEVEEGKRIRLEPNSFLPAHTQYKPTLLKTIKNKFYEFLRRCKTRNG
jgi:hypothetical protein